MRASMDANGDAKMIIRVIGGVILVLGVLPFLLALWCFYTLFFDPSVSHTDGFGGVGFILMLVFAGIGIGMFRAGYMLASKK